jgi:hydrogenase maturation factor HypF (carbamoyltransferase family)
MTIYQQLKQQLQSVSNLLQHLKTDQYTYKTKHLSNATIGGHTRHIIELLWCVVNGHQSGTIDYINRKRNLSLESNKDLAIEIIENLLSVMELQDKSLDLYNEDGSFSTTSYNRELVYNIEHIIHHLALMKVALIELNITDLVEDSFGFAYSTIKYKLTLQS